MPTLAEMAPHAALRVEFAGPCRGQVADRFELSALVRRAGVDDKSGQIQELLGPLVGGKGFTGRAPGGKSRWSDNGSTMTYDEPPVFENAGGSIATSKEKCLISQLMQCMGNDPPELRGTSVQSFPHL